MSGTVERSVWQSEEEGVQTGQITWASKGQLMDFDISSEWDGKPLGFEQGSDSL